MSRYGTLGTRTHSGVAVNAFEVKWSSSSRVHHYDVITPQFQSRSGRPIKLGGEKGTEIIHRLQSRIAPQYFPHPSAFDGKKNIYAFHAFPFSNQAFTVPWDDARNSPKTVTVTIVWVQEVNVGLLRRLLEGRFLADPQRVGSDVSASINMLQCFVQAAPRMAEGNLFKGNSVYVRSSGNMTQDQRRAISNVSPLTLRDGFFQSIRPTINRLIINVDTTVGVILPRQALIDTCTRFLNLRDARELATLRADQLDKLKGFLRGVKVTISKQIAGASSRMRARPIRGLVPDVGSYAFERDGMRVTVGAHFQQVHAYPIPPRSLGVLIGRHEVFPVALCDVPEQIYKPKLNPDHVRNILAFLPQNPQDRLRKIQTGWENLGHRNSQFLIGAGIRIDSTPLVVNGRFLTPPNIQYGGPLGPKGQQRQTVSLEQRPGSWDVMGKILHSPWAAPCTVVLINFVGSTPQAMVYFVKDLIEAMLQRGLNINPSPPPIQSFHPQASMEKIFHTAVRTAGVNPAEVLILAILPDPAPGLYERVKRMGDVTLGFPTQCVRWTRKLEGDASRGKCNQYHNNLILKINGKLGGTNHVVKSPGMGLLKEAPTMVIGADVSHPAPGSMGPSYASLVASLDPDCTRYTAQINVQSSRLEMIEHVANMALAAARMFKDKNPHHLLERIVFYRDGVSEGEFELVRQAELEPIKKKFAELYANLRVKIRRPTFTFIVVGKRHHFRFFPSNPRDQDARSGNYKSGLVVDQGIEHPVYQDFYLQSQPGLKGTSIPAHYTVIEDENFGRDPDKLQAISYDLCHCYSRATKSVKIPAPVYYADLVCRRAKFHLDEDFQMSDDMSNDSSGSHIVQTYKQHFKSVNSRFSHGMYFL